MLSYGQLADLWVHWTVPRIEKILKTSDRKILLLWAKSIIIRLLPNTDVKEKRYRQANLG